MRISDWSSDVCSSDLSGGPFRFAGGFEPLGLGAVGPADAPPDADQAPMAKEGAGKLQAIDPVQIAPRLVALQMETFIELLPIHDLILNQASLARKNIDRTIRLPNTRSSGR